jgi:hypothetical protein
VELFSFVYARNEDGISLACAHATERHLHGENQESRPHPQISPVFLVGTIRREEPHRLHAVVHRTRDAWYHSKLHGSEPARIIIHTDSHLMLSKGVTIAVHSKAHTRAHASAASEKTTRAG